MPPLRSVAMSRPRRPTGVLRRMSTRTCSAPPVLARGRIVPVSQRDAGAVREAGSSVCAKGLSLALERARSCCPGRAMRSRVRRFAHLLERLGLAMAGAACGLFVSAHVGSSISYLTSQAFLLLMMIAGAVAFYLG